MTPMDIAINQVAPEVVKEIHNRAIEAGEMKMKSVSMGSKKKVFKSVRLAADAAGKDYMVIYMRLRMGMSPAKALSKPVRKYTKA